MIYVKEGFIRTYPPDTAISYLKDYFEFENFQIKKEKAVDGIEKIKIALLNINRNIDEVERAMRLCGYYLSYPRKETLPENTTVTLVFESLWTDKEI